MVDDMGYTNATPSFLSEGNGLGEEDGEEQPTKIINKIMYMFFICFPSNRLLDNYE